MDIVLLCVVNVMLMEYEKNVLHIIRRMKIIIRFASRKTQIVNHMIAKKQIFAVTVNQAIL